MVWLLLLASFRFFLFSHILPNLLLITFLREHALRKPLRCCPSLDWKILMISLRKYGFIYDSTPPSDRGRYDIFVAFGTYDWSCKPFLSSRMMLWPLLSVLPSSCSLLSNGGQVDEQFRVDMWYVRTWCILFFPSTFSLHVEPHSFRGPQFSPKSFAVLPHLFINSSNFFLT